MIALRGRSLEAQLNAPLRRDLWRIVRTATGADGEAVVVAENGANVLLLPRLDGADRVVLPSELSYLDDGDVVALAPDGRRIDVLWRRRSRHNSVLLTEQCDNFCLMCSQPPRAVDDRHLVQRARRLVRLIPPDAEELGLTGGEPTLQGTGLLDLLRDARRFLPRTELHLLSNGRRFADAGFADDYAAAANPRLMVGIPVYAGEASLHDYVVQAPGAFDDTINGILNLAERRQRIEIRVVLQRHTAPALSQIADFIVRNLPFVEQVALMGLEMTGFAWANRNDVWIDPVDYQAELADAALRLRAGGLRVLIYNHSLCLLDRRIWPLAVRSISDWKSEYHEECRGCGVLDRCGGLFATARGAVSVHLRAQSSDAQALAGARVGS